MLRINDYAAAAAQSTPTTSHPPPPPLPSHLLAGMIRQRQPPVQQPVHIHVQLPEEGPVTGQVHPAAAAGCGLLCLCGWIQLGDAGLVRRGVCRRLGR